MTRRPILLALTLLLLGAPAFTPDTDARGLTGTADARAALEAPAPADPGHGPRELGVALASSEPTESEDVDGDPEELRGALPVTAFDATPPTRPAHRAALDLDAAPRGPRRPSGLPRGPPALG